MQRHTKPIQNPYALARTVFTREVMRFYKRQQRYYVKKGKTYQRGTYEPTPEQLDESHAVTEVTQLDLLAVDDYFLRLEQQHGAEARRAAEHLVNGGARREVEKLLLERICAFTREWLAGT